MHKVTGVGEKGAWSVLDVAHDLVVAQFASPNTAPKLVSTLTTTEWTPDFHKLRVSPVDYAVDAIFLYSL